MLNHTHKSPAFQKYHHSCLLPREQLAAQDLLYQSISPVHVNFGLETVLNITLQVYWYKHYC